MNGLIIIEGLSEKIIDELIRGFMTDIMNRLISERIIGK